MRVYDDRQGIRHSLTRHIPARNPHQRPEGRVRTTTQGHLLQPHYGYASKGAVAKI